MMWCVWYHGVVYHDVVCVVSWCGVWCIMMWCVGYHDVVCMVS